MDLMGKAKAAAKDAAASAKAAAEENAKTVADSAAKSAEEAVDETVKVAGAALNRAVAGFGNRSGAAKPAQTADAKPAAAPTKSVAAAKPTAAQAKPAPSAARTAAASAKSDAAPAKPAAAPTRPAAGAKPAQTADAKPDAAASKPAEGGKLPMPPTGRAAAAARAVGMRPGAKPAEGDRPPKPGEGEAPPAVKTAFEDIPEDAPYAMAVNWAVDKGITNGTSETTFSPDAACTRGQVITFIWRAKGKPEPKGEPLPFADVAADSPFCKAISWAYESEIASGIGADAFSPDQECTNGQFITFLWRAQGKPAAKGNSTLADAAGDVYYKDALAWADTARLLGPPEKGFAADESCIRSGVVDVLFHSMNPAPHGHRPPPGK